MIKKLIKSFNKIQFESYKYLNYFDVYDNLFYKFIGKKIKIVEIGIFNGGSLFMWRDYFGPQAEIIGIDLNPKAKELEKYGFKIYIGNQEDDKFWKAFFKKEKDIDIVIDDGGHTNLQQLTTLINFIPKIKKNGLIIIEDTHSSYQKKFGNPSPLSFINITKKFVDNLNFRFAKTKNSDLISNYVFSISYFESIVCFQINKDLCKTNKPVISGKDKIGASDMRHNIQSITALKLINILRFFKLHNFILFIFYKLKNGKVKKYLKNIRS